MWISKMLSKKEAQPTCETGRVTMSSNGSVEAVSTGVDRNVNIYSPFGYSFCATQGEEVLLSSNGAQRATLGFAMKNENLKSGEIKITSLSGAYILLKNDGSVVINGLEISKDGVINDK